MNSKIIELEFTDDFFKNKDYTATVCEEVIDNLLLKAVQSNDIRLDITDVDRVLCTNGKAIFVEELLDLEFKFQDIIEIFDLLDKKYQIFSKPKRLLVHIKSSRDRKTMQEVHKAISEIYSKTNDQVEIFMSASKVYENEIGPMLTICATGLSVDNQN